VFIDPPARVLRAAGDYNTKASRNVPAAAAD